MTRKEAIEYIQEILGGGNHWLPYSDPAYYEALRIAISALQPWHKLSEEKPPEEGIYWVFIPNWYPEKDRVVKDKWHKPKYRSEMIFCSDAVTHWRLVEHPEDDNDWFPRGG